MIEMSLLGLTLNQAKSVRRRTGQGLGQKVCQDHQATWKSLRPPKGDYEALSWRFWQGKDIPCEDIFLLSWWPGSDAKCYVSVFQTVQGETEKKMYPWTKNSKQHSVCLLLYQESWPIWLISGQKWHWCSQTFACCLWKKKETDRVKKKQTKWVKSLIAQWQAQQDRMNEWMELNCGDEPNSRGTRCSQTFPVANRWPVVSWSFIRITEGKHGCATLLARLCQKSCMDLHDKGVPTWIPLYFAAFQFSCSILQLRFTMIHLKATADASHWKHQPISQDTHSVWRLASLGCFTPQKWAHVKHFPNIKGMVCINPRVMLSS